MPFGGKDHKKDVALHAATGAYIAVHPEASSAYKLTSIEVIHSLNAVWRLCWEHPYHHVVTEQHAAQYKEKLNGIQTAVYQAQHLAAL
ncbi:hypothetical protein MFKK_17610 [Halopseudomonas aestusnigri]|nr:hypothetical protein MFKK_17610 [Halopseudomonas aestusnigri]